MKSFLAILAASLVLCGCEVSERDKYNRFVAEKDVERANEFIIKDPNRGIHRFNYAVIDGHEYILCHHDRGIGISHSPKCHCMEGR